ncbi:MAG: TraR/DksA C4-type zinc finger protein [Patescibacteria group bacterium]
MEKKTLEKFKKLLEGEKKKLKKQLQSFAKPNASVRDDYETKMPQIGDSADDNAIEIAMYDNALSLERNFESRIKNINAALKKIEKDKYGICEECKKNISDARLKLYPEARHCMRCHKNNKVN